MPYKDPEVQREYRREYARTHREQDAARNKLWREHYAGRVAETQAAYREANRETLRLKSREYYHGP